MIKHKELTDHQKKKLEEAYYDWLNHLKKTADIKDCPINVMTFLDSRGWIKGKGFTNKKLVLKKYQKLLPVIEKVAHERGYAITVHGSLGRDLDLVAIPWVEGAFSSKDLVEAVRLTVNGIIDEQPTVKPFGRTAWSIQIGAGLYVDLSVIAPESFQQKT